MSTAAVSAFDNTVQTTYEWLNDLKTELGRDDSQQAYRILRAVLFALRDRLTVEEATDFGAQLPMLIRGIYYEGWNPAKSPSRERSQEEFLSHISENLSELRDGDPAEVTQAVCKVISRRVTKGEVDHIKANLPKDIQTLWPA